MSRPPNILLITTDQQRWDHLGLEGVKGITTPHLDRLGREGIHFHRAYCPSPMCTPARVSLLTGQLENTLVIFTSDHGEYHGHHGFWGKGLPAYDDAQRVPLLMRGPGVKAVGKCRELVSLVDLPKTILSLAGAPIPRGMQGASLTDLLCGQSQHGPEEVLVECRPNESGIYQQTYVTDQYKLVVYRELETGELYDLEADPDQYVNLWNQPEYKDLKLSLLEKFARFNLKKDGEVNPRTAFA